VSRSALGRPALGRPLVVALRALGLGDLLAAVPAVRALRRGCPDAELVLAVPAALAPIAALTGAVDCVHPAAPLAPLRLARRPDLAVNLHGSGPQSARVLLAERPRRLLSYACPGLPETAGGPAWAGEEHEVARWCRLVAHGGFPADPGDLLLDRPGVASPAPGAVVVHPGAAYGSRRWPAPRFAAVARELAGRGQQVVVTGSAQERPLAAAVADAAGLPGEAVLAGRTDLTRLAALIAGARLVVSGDTGVAHLASAFAIPSVVLFGPTSPARWGPPATPRHVAIWRGTSIGDRFADRPDPALLAIDPGSVLAAAEQVLAAAAQNGDRPVTPPR